MFVEVSEEWFVYKTELYTIDVVFSFFICLHLFHHFYQRMPLRHQMTPLQKRLLILLLVHLLH